MDGRSQTFRPVIVGGSDRLWLMAQHIASKTAVRPDRARSLADTVNQPQSNMSRTQALVGAGMSPSALNAFLVRFGFANTSDVYVRQ